MNKQSEIDFLLEKSREGSEKSKAALLENLKPLILSSIKKYHHAEYEFEELVHEGQLAVLECIEKFDKSLNVPFLGFVKSRLRYLYMNMSAKKIKKNCLSLNDEITGKDGRKTELIDLLPDDFDFMNIIILNENISELKQALKNLSGREKQVVFMFYMEEMNLNQVSEKLGIAYRTVVNTKTNAIIKLRQTLIL